MTGFITEPETDSGRYKSKTTMNVGIYCIQHNSVTDYNMLRLVFKDEMLCHVTFSVISIHCMIHRVTFQPCKCSRQEAV